MLDALTLKRQAAGGGELLELVRQARSGDLQAFDRLIRSCERRVMRLAYQMVGNADDAQDVAQDVYIRLWKYLDRIRDEAKFSTWLYRMVMNASYDLLARRRGAREQLSFDDPDGAQHELADEAAVPLERGVVAADLRDRVLDALGALTPSERTIFVLKDVEGLEVKEIAVIHESSPITVRRHLSSARHKMRAVLIRLYPGFAKKGGESEP